MRDWGPSRSKSLLVYSSNRISKRENLGVGARFLTLMSTCGHRCLSLPSLSSVNAIDCCLLLSLLLQDSLGDTLIWVFEMIAATLISSLSLLAVAKGAALAPQAACAVTFDGRIKAEATVADFDGGSTGFRSGYVLGQSKQQCNDSHITKANSLRSKVG